MAQIVDQFGNPIQREVFDEPQTSRIAQLQNAYLTSSLDGLTPARLAAVLRAADAGDLTAQHRLFADMEQRDAHLICEIGKRKNALLGPDWDIVPPPNPSAKEKADAEWLKEMLTDAVDPIEDLILALMDGPGHGFAPVEQEWRKEGSLRLPAWYPRPQEWFRLDNARREELRLQDGSMEGAALWPFGWVMHTHGKAKTGYQGRMGLHRVTVWPFLYKAYAVGDFAEFLETYGLPIIVGKYYSGASADEKDSLFRAVTSLGHDARAIMPVDMQLEIQKVTGSGDGTPHLAMVGWADGAQSKAILGQVLSAEAKSTGLGSGVADVHNEVRKDIRNADARQVAATITRDVCYAMLAVNRGVDGLARCARFRFDTGEPEDIKTYADALPKLAPVMPIPAEWAYGKLRIPVPKDGEAVLQAVAQQPPSPGGNADKPPVVANSAVIEPAAPDIPDQAAIDAALDAIPAENLQAASEALLAPVMKMIDEAGGFEAALAALSSRYPDMDAGRLEDMLARMMFAAELHGYANSAT